jgi:hypothetical protein
VFSIGAAMRDRAERLASDGADYAGSKALDIAPGSFARLDRRHRRSPADQLAAA